MCHQKVAIYRSTEPFLNNIGDQNMQKEFTPGTVVKLISGGPSMTVHGTSGEYVRCTWFDVHNQVHNEPFHLATVIADDGRGSSTSNFARRS